MKFTKQQLKEYIRSAVRNKLNEAVDDPAPEDWVKHLQEVDGFINETIEKAKKLHDKGEELKQKEREHQAGKTRYRTGADSTYAALDERQGFLSGLVSKLAQKYEAWRVNR